MGIRNGTLVFTIVAISSVIVLSNFSSVYANHVPTDIDNDDDLWSPADGFRDGYLEFINPIEHPGLLGTMIMTSPPMIIYTEEFTGYTLADGTDIIEIMDNEMSHGDKADFDWVQEDRAAEISGGGNHPFMLGALGWTFDSPEMSAHMDVSAQGAAVKHGHSLAESPAGTLPELDNDACIDKFEFVDVFSIISDGEDNDSTIRNSALDYVVDFGDSSNPLASTPGIPTLVFTKGWTTSTTIDDYVARWMPMVPGKYDVIAIEPIASEKNDGSHDQSIEIDAVKCYISVNSVGGEMIPIDATAVLLAGIQTNAYGIFSTLVVIGTVAFGGMYYSAKRKRN